MRHSYFNAYSIECAPPGMPTELKRQVARLFSTLEYGEQLAHHCANKQASWITDRRERRFLQVQARQEATHAWFYRQAAQYLKPKHGYAIPCALKRFGQRLENAMARDDLNETLVGSQVVLEGFGEQVLLRLNRCMDEQGVGFRRIRHLFLRQEQSHHAFGFKILSTRVEQEKVGQGQLHELTEAYLSHIGAIIDEMDDIFVAFNTEPGEYIEDMLRVLPDWLYGQGG